MKQPTCVDDEEIGNSRVPCLMGRAVGQLVACVLWYCNTPNSHCPICSINIYITLQKADEPNFLLKKKKGPKCYSLLHCSPVPTPSLHAALSPCFWEYAAPSSSRCHLQCWIPTSFVHWAAWLLSEVVWYFRSFGLSEVSAIALLLSVLSSLSSCCAFPGKDLAIQLHILQHFWLYLLRKYVKLFPGFCSVALPHRPDTSWSGGMGTGRGFLRPLIYLSWWQFLKTEVELL